MTYYLAAYIIHPFEDNTQLCIDCKSEAEAHQIAGVISSWNGVPVRVSTKPGYQSSCDYIYGKSSLDGKIKTVTYRKIEM